MEINYIESNNRLTFAVILLVLLSAMHKSSAISLAILMTFVVSSEAVGVEYHEREFDIWMESSEPGEYPALRDSAGLDSMIRYKMVENHIPGVSTIALKDGQIIWSNSYGYAVLEDSIPVADSTLFYLASISKTSVAIALMQIWEQLSFSLDDDVGAHLGFPVRNPYYPDSVISIRMCMTHMSSINDNFTILDPLNIQGDSPIPLGEFLEEYLVPGGKYYSVDNFNPWPPATQDDYCNMGAAICGYIVELYTDSFPLYCHDSIFDPLDMYETAWFLSQLDTGNIAMPYHWDGSNYIPYGHIGKPYYPCGTLRSSSRQLTRLLTAFMQYGVIDDTVRILDSTTVELMTTSQYPVLNPEQGLFWYKKFLDGRWIWGHQGWSHGIRGRIAYDWNNNTAAVVLTNGEDIGSVTEITVALLNYAAQLGVAELEKTVLKNGVMLQQNNPNPFSGSTKIEFTLTKAGNVALSIYNTLGQKVTTLVDRELRAGHYDITWDATGLPSGVYHYQLSTERQVHAKHCILLR